MSLTPNAIRDGDPYALALLVERRGGPVLAYADELTPPDRALTATAEAFAQFRTAVANAPDPNALDPETALLEATRAAVARHAENPYRPAGRERPTRRTRTCELMPRLLVAWTEGRLSIEDEHRLVRHLRPCPDCRALNDAFARAEERYRNGPPAAMDAAEVAMIVSSTVAAAPTPPPTNRPVEEAPAPEAVQPAPPPPVAEDPLLASAHAEPEDEPAGDAEPVPAVDPVPEPEDLAEPARAAEPEAYVEPAPLVDPGPEEDVEPEIDVEPAPAAHVEPEPQPVEPLAFAPDPVPEPARIDDEPDAHDVPGPAPDPSGIAGGSATTDPAPARPEPAPPAPRGRGGGIGASALRRVVGVPGSLGRLVGGGTPEPARDPEPTPAARSHDPDAALPTRRPAPSDAPLLHGTVDDPPTRIDDDLPADDAPAETASRTGVEPAAPARLADPEPPSSPDDDPRGSWSTVVLAPDDPVGPEALGYVVPQPGLPRPSRTPPRRRRRTPAVEAPAPTPAVEDPAPAAPAPEAILDAPALEPVADPVPPEPEPAPDVAVDAPVADPDPAADDALADEVDDDLPPADVTAVHAIPVLPDAVDAPDEDTAPPAPAPPRARAVPLEEPQAYVVPEDPHPESYAVIADAPRPVPPATVDGASPRVRSSSSAATIVRQLGIPAVLLIVVLVAALAAAGAFSTNGSDDPPSTPTTPSGVPSSPQQVPSLPIPR